MIHTDITMLKQANDALRNQIKQEDLVHQLVIKELKANITNIQAKLNHKKRVIKKTR